MLFILGINDAALGQFTVIPTGTNSDITDLALHGDTVLISGKDNYLAKSFDWGSSVVQFSSPNMSSYSSFDFQVNNGFYYLLSQRSSPYEVQVLKSSNHGQTWNVVNDTTGLFMTLCIVDSSFGVMAGTFGTYGMFQNNDQDWLLDTLFGSWYVQSTASSAWGDSALILMTVDGFSFMTNDRGQTWSWGNCPGEVHETVKYINEDTLYSVSHSGTVNPKATFSYSYDGGDSWSFTPLGYNDTGGFYDFYSRVFDFWFETPQHGYLVGYDYDSDESIIMETFDAGLTFDTFRIGYVEELLSIINVNDSLAFIGGSNGLLLKWDKSQLVHVGEGETNNSRLTMKVYPNPVSQGLNIAFSIPVKGLNISFFDVSGKCVLTYSEQVTIPVNVLRIDKLPTKGAYMLKVESTDGVGHARVIIR